MIKILLVDDHPMVRLGMKLMLDQQIELLPVITEVDNGPDAIKEISTNQYDIVLLDINLPAVNGIAIIKEVRSRGIDTPILAVTMHNEEHIVKQVLEAGAMGYVIKNCGMEEMTKAIKTLLNKEKYYCNEATQALLARVPLKKAVIRPENALVKRLTDRERRVLELVANEMTNNEIAEKLDISKRTVEGHRSKIISKLEVKNTAGLIRFAMENKLVS